MTEPRNYFIVPSTEISNIDFECVAEVTEETLIISVDGTKTFVKWVGESPPEFVISNNYEGPYNYEELSNILSGPEWSN
jgi:hypothetical protein